MIKLTQKQISDLSINIGKEAGKSGGDAYLLFMYLIQKHNSIEALGKLKYGKMFYFTYQQAEEILGMARRRFVSAVSTLESLGLIVTLIKKDDETNYKHKYFMIHEDNLNIRIKSTKTTDEAAELHDMLSDEHNEPKAETVDVQKVPTMCRSINTSFVVVNDEKINEIIMLSGNRLDDNSIKTMLQDTNNNYDIIMDKLNIAISQYGSLDKINNLVGWLRKAIQNNYTYSVPNHTSDQDNKLDIDIVKKEMGYKSLHPHLASRVQGWISRVGLDSVIKAIRKTIELIANPSPAYIDKIVNDMERGAYKEYNNKKSKKNFYNDYEQRNYSSEFLEELEMELLSR